MISLAVANPIIDTHCHIDDTSFDSDRDAVIQRASQSGVVAQVIPSVCRARFDAVRAICNRYAGLHPAYGLHPLFFDQHDELHVNQLAHWLNENDAVAVGECGLDHHTAKADRKTQEQLFVAQLSIAVDNHLPLIVHANKAVEAVVNCIRGFSTSRGVVHSFNGSQPQAEMLIDRGWKLGFGGAITHPKATRLRKLVQQLPLEAILLETDAPFQSGLQQRGQRNEPAFVTSVLSTLAELHHRLPIEVAQTTTQNAENLFRLAATGSPTASHSQ